MPRVSVILPVFNGAAFLAEAVESILAQSFGDYELIVVDDGSEDATPAVLDAVGDPRLRRYRQPVNLGVAAAVNLAHAVADGEYLARMDADDIALPERLDKQVTFLDDHPEVWACGGHMEKFGRLEGVAPLPREDAVIKANLLPARGNIMNPTAMLRRAPVDRHGLRADSALPGGIDYAFWSSVMLAGGVFANLPDVLLRYRWHRDNVTARNPGMKPGVRRTRAAVARAFYPHLTSAEVQSLLLLFDPPGEVPRAAVEGAVAAAEAARRDVWSRYGEDRARLARDLQARAQALLAG